MNRQQCKNELMAFLGTIQKPGYSIEAIDADESLVESGCLDSLAVVQIIVYLENRHGIDFHGWAGDPRELRSINSILDLISRISK
jgi:acyl carrier protein